MVSVDTLVSVGAKARMRDGAGERRRCQGQVDLKAPSRVGGIPPTDLGLPRGYGGGARRRLAAILTRPATESAGISRITRPRCAFTVIALTPSAAATCLFNRPATTRARTSRSRRLSDA